MPTWMACLSRISMLPSSPTPCCSNWCKLTTALACFRKCTSQNKISHKSTKFSNQTKARSSTRSKARCTSPTSPWTCFSKSSRWTRSASCPARDNQPRRTSPATQPPSCSHNHLLSSRNSNSSSNSKSPHPRTNSSMAACITTSPSLSPFPNKCSHSNNSSSSNSSRDHPWCQQPRTSKSPSQTLLGSAWSRTTTTSSSSSSSPLLAASCSQRSFLLIYRSLLPIW